MKHFLRLGWTVVAAGGATLAVCVSQVAAQPVTVFSDTPAYLAHSSQSYLGVNMRDIDNDRATELKLKDAHGAEITTVDHDAPANKAGLKVHDVVLEMNGERVEGAEQFRRMLRETPPGHTIHLLISRDGQQQNISVELADRAKIEANAWSQHFTVPDPDDAPLSNGLLPPSRSFGNGFFGVFTTSGLYVGADVDVLSTQLASYFGVTDGTGLLVKSVDENSPAATAGLKAGDVITKVNNENMASRADWMKALHSNRGKQVQLTVMRDKKEQKLNMQAGEPKKKGELDFPEFCPDVMVFDGPEGKVDLGALAMLDSQEMARMAQSIDATKLTQALRDSLNTIDLKKMQQDIQKQLETLDSGWIDRDDIQ
ncbi:PDZ domain-containing protein [Alloacidobacterium sp.]|uniref:PDZ domain-containing protein n=1 Tax=Alloacidobacterium sp. TaxID=2951999 RepID=UPI002D4B36BE|nr:PDZ domain-containing protein [Alloacidobacterium sp.]HYK38361.1 PDZ domain-containing protein [Alloacidobacterium sp.]